MILMIYYYLCTINDTIAFIQTVSIEEDTLVAPKIVKKLPKVVQTKEGDRTTLEVKAIGKPMPTPKWLKANEEIIPSDEYLIENYPDGTSLLTITNVQPELIDQITFEAVSVAGTAKTTTKLQVEGILSYIVAMVLYLTAFTI